MHEVQRNQELYHYGVKGMKWGVRRAQKYEVKAKRYRSSYAETHDPIKRSKFKAKADEMDVKARFAREGKADLKMLRKASKLKGNYTDTQGLLRGPYADAVGSIRAQKGERYAAEVMRKHQTQEVNKFIGLMTAGTAAYAVGMTYLASKL